MVAVLPKPTDGETFSIEADLIKVDVDQIKRMPGVAQLTRDIACYRAPVVCYSPVAS